VETKPLVERYDGGIIIDPSPSRVDLILYSPEERYPIVPRPSTVENIVSRLGMGIPS